MAVVPALRVLHLPRTAAARHPRLQDLCMRLWRKARASGAGELYFAYRQIKKNHQCSCATQARRIDLHAFKEFASTHTALHMHACIAWCAAPRAQ